VTLELRPYQHECLERLKQRYRQGKRRVLVSLPTGTGKTVIFAHFPRYFRMKKRLLVLAHREELLQQAKDKFDAVAPQARAEIEQAGLRASAQSQVVLASVPTLGRKGSARLARLDPQDFYLVVVDEAHHAVAKTYRRIFDHFGLFSPDTPRMLVGFTATPGRGDGQGLGQVFEEIAYDSSLELMIQAGYLCQVSGWRVTSGVDLDGVKVRAGDFVESQLAQAVDVAPRNALLVRAYHELAPGRRAIVFCANVQHAQDVARAFSEAGVQAEAVWGAMPRPDRREVLRRFSAGELDVVTNCQILTEGFDEPRVDCIIMGRPTKSRLLYAQMVGRGTRLHEDKSDLLVVDVADNSDKHSLAGLHALFKLPARLDLQGQAALAVAARLRATAERYPWVDVERIETPGDLELVAERVDLFHLDPPEEVQPYSDFTWCRAPDGAFRLGLPQQESLLVRQNLLDRWEVVLRPAGPDREQGLGIHDTLGQALTRADAWVQRRRSDVVRVVDAHAGWRDRPATEAQLETLGRQGVKVPLELTRGQASWMIGMLMARR
jgi:ATP-dependent helicase IRC3